MPSAKKTGILLALVMLILTPVWSQYASLEPPPEQFSDYPDRYNSLRTEQTEYTAETEVKAEPPVKRIDSYSVSLFPLFGFLIGQVEELVYESPGSALYKSQLTWDLKPLAYFGFNVDFDPRNPFEKHGIIASTAVKIGLPFKTGIMEDVDWYMGNITDYSTHDAYNMNAILLDVSGGYSWHLGKIFTLGANAKFSYMYFSWSAEDGSGVYDIYSMAWRDVNFSGPVVLYSQHWIIFSPGILAKVKIGKYFTIDGNISYSPLTFCIARDDHLLRNMIFRDYSYFGHYIDGGLKLTYSLHPKIDLSLFVSYRHIMGSRGNSFFQDGGETNDTNQYANGESGAGFSALNLGLAVRISVFGGQQGSSETPTRFLTISR